MRARSPAKRYRQIANAVKWDFRNRELGLNIFTWVINDSRVINMPEVIEVAASAMTIKFFHVWNVPVQPIGCACFSGGHSVAQATRHSYKQEMATEFFLVDESEI